MARKLRFQTRTDTPFKVYLVADPGVQDLNSKEEIKAYLLDKGDLRTDPESCTPYSIRALSYKERQSITEELDDEFEGLSGKAAVMVSKEEVSGLTEEGLIVYKRFSLMRIAHDLKLVKAALMNVEGEEEPEGGWVSMFDPFSDTGYSPLSLRAELLTELASLIREASDLGPKARPRYKQRFGLVTPVKTEEPITLGDVTTVATKSDNSEEGAEEPSSQDS